jgi:hypothetical protein
LCETAGKQPCLQGKEHFFVLRMHAMRAWPEKHLLGTESNRLPSLSYLLDEKGEFRQSSRAHLRYFFMVIIIIFVGSRYYVSRDVLQTELFFAVAVRLILKKLTPSFVTRSDACVVQFLGHSLSRRRYRKSPFIDVIDMNESQSCTRSRTHTIRKDLNFHLSTSYVSRLGRTMEMKPSEGPSSHLPTTTYVSSPTSSHKICRMYKKDRTHL